MLAWRVVAAFALLLVPGMGSGALAQTTSPATSVDVTVTDTGLQPSSVTLASGGSVHWTNSSTQNQTIFADDGLFDSGSLPPGAGFSIALGITGTHTYHVGALVGSILVAAPPSLLAGPPTDPAASHIPDKSFPVAEPAEFSTNPTTGVTMSRTRILVTFKPSATVADDLGGADRALSR